ncbi:MAG: carboxypeptidase M32 [Alphaproteobacteria bacterium]|nr:carboxypeptidase M32 [Alphaproteobacteria bacterium]
MNTETKKDDYKELESRFDEIGRLGYMSALIGWDSRVCAPQDAGEEQGEQMAYLSMKQHEIMTRPDWKEMFDRLEKRTDLNDWQQANVREAKQEWIRETALPEALVEQSAKTANAGQSAWVKAKADSDFKSFAPHLQKLVAVARETAAALSAKTGQKPYDALLDMYQPGMTSDKLDVLFNDLKEFLPDFIKEAQKQNVGGQIEPFKGDYPLEKQTEFAKRLMQTMGFDFNRGRMDMSSSAFQTTCGKDDMRVVGRYDLDNPLRSVSAIMHETGHGMYEQGLPKEHMLQPVGKPRGMALHESQSLLMQGPVLQSNEFIRYLSKQMNEFYKTDECSVEHLTKQMHSVQPSLIRINADEATYPLHVIMRYELEKDLINGDLEVKDLPKAWNAKMKEYLGVEPKNDKEGCLQDIHWAAGNFGYFPDYTVGAIAAAQFFEAAKKQVPEIPRQLEKGDFSGLKSWLNENVHSQASKLSFNDLIKKATGKELSTEAFKNSLRERYLGGKSEKTSVRSAALLQAKTAAER